MRIDFKQAVHTPAVLCAANQGLQVFVLEITLENTDSMEMIMELNGDEEGDMEDGFALGEGDLFWSRPGGVRTLREWC